MLSKSRLDGKHKVINLRPGWMAFGEEIPSSVREDVRRRRAHQTGFSIRIRVKVKLLLTRINLIHVANVLQREETKPRGNHRNEKQKGEDF